MMYNDPAAFQACCFFGWRSGEMSGGAVFQEALRVLTALELPSVAERDCVAAMEAARPGNLSLLYEAGAAAGLKRALLLRRCAACFFAYVGGSVADDLADNECEYLEHPIRTGPSIVFLMEHLFLCVMAEADVALPVIARASADLVQAAARQQIEVRTREWTAALFQEVAEVGAGRPFAAWLAMLWHGTPEAARAESIGLKVGVVAQTAGDVRSCDPRFTSLPAEDQRRVLAWSRAAADELRGQALPWVPAFLAPLDELLKPQPERAA
jgi:hypothetical protein